MTSRLTFAVRDWYAWSPAQDGPGRAFSTEQGRGAELPMMMRRRLSSSGQAVMKAALSCVRDRQGVRYVLATRDGELHRTLSILTAIAQNDLPSPADFSVSVHHALLGLLSIYTNNKAGHTAVSAGPDTFGYGLLEAAGCIAQKSDEAVLLLYCDEPLPEAYAAFEDVDAARHMQIIALLLERPSSAGDNLSLSLAETNPDMRRVPSLAQDFLAFLESDQKCRVAAGVDMAWEWSRAA